MNRQESSEAWPHFDNYTLNVGHFRGRVSIVVAVFDGAKTIESCLQSVLEQTYPLKEVVIIDGGSSDGTVDILKKYESAIEYWISEPDQGIYNAWNKALDVVTGEWICFIGSDDKWACADSLAKLVSLAKFPEVNFVSGHNRMVDAVGMLGRVYGNEWNFSEMKTRMTVAHVGALHHRTLFEKYGLFDESYRIAGDYEFLLRVGFGIRGAYIAEDVILMGSGGVSRMQSWLVIKEGRRALCESLNAGIFYGWSFYIKALAKYAIRTLLYFSSMPIRKRGTQMSDRF